MVNLFKAEGDYENRNKARVRYIVERMGEEAFIEAYQKHLDEAKNKGGLELNITPQEIHKMETLKEDDNPVILKYYLK